MTSANRRSISRLFQGFTLDPTSEELVPSARERGFVIYRDDELIEAIDIELRSVSCRSSSNDGGSGSSKRAQIP
jgi:hypothetical protein